MREKSLAAVSKSWDGIPRQIVTGVPRCVSRPGLNSIRRTASSTLFALNLSLSAAFCLGCANPGPPKSPSLHLPSPVTDLSAQRIGNRVLLRWTTPSRTTDDFAVKGALTAQICRETGSRPGNPSARRASCAAVLRLAVAPGPSEVSDTLPAALRSDPVLLMTYRIQILNSSERSAGDSASAAVAAAGTAPPFVDALNVSASEQGAVLEWASATTFSGSEIEFARSNDSAPAIVKASRPARDQPAKGYPLKPARSSAPETSAQTQPEAFRLRAAETPNQSLAGSTDTTAKAGSTYTYVAKRIRTVTLGQQHLEIASEQSAPVTVAMRDTFPPRAPADLATIATTAEGAATAPYIDLSWEPGAEPDLAGYFVYRELARADRSPSGPSSRLTPTLLTAPVYRDVAVSPGQRYIYWVTAVDASGNESAPSTKIQEVITPEKN